MTMKTPPKLWSVTLLIALGVGLWLLLPQLGVVVFTALMALVFYPLYKRLKRKKGGMAAVTTLLVSFLIVLIPVGFVVTAAIGQLANFAESASQSQHWSNMPSSIQEAVSITNDILEPITGNRPTISDTSVIEFLRNTLPSIAHSTTQFILGIAGSIPQLVIGLIIYAFLFLELLRYGPKLIEKLETISPFDKDVTKQYIERIGLMAKAMVTGQLIISMIISAFGATLLAFIGYGQYFFIFFMLLTVLNFIPLGGGVMIVPLAIATMLSGDIWPGVIVIVLYYLFGNIEPIMRARLIPKKIELSVGLTILATFCGIAYFGLLGVVYGPIIMILIVTTIEFYEKAKAAGAQQPKTLQS